MGAACPSMTTSVLATSTGTFPDASSANPVGAGPIPAPNSVIISPGEMGPGVSEALLTIPARTGASKGEAVTPRANGTVTDPPVHWRVTLPEYVPGHWALTCTCTTAGVTSVFP